MAADLNTLYLDVPAGRVVIAMRPDLAPDHVAQIKASPAARFYDGVPFHRVIDGFMAQTGDPTGTKRRSGHKLSRILRRKTRPQHHLDGAATIEQRRQQFFIMFAPAPSSTAYTIWGQVTSGMESMIRSKRAIRPAGTVANPDKIVKMQVAADAEKAKWPPHPTFPGLVILC